MSGDFHCAPATYLITAIYIISQRALLDKYGFYGLQPGAEIRATNKTTNLFCRYYGLTGGT